MATGKESGRDNKLNVSGQVIFTEEGGGLPKVNVTTEWSSAEIYLNGAHVTHFQKKGEDSLLFLSQSSRFEDGHPIRGGIPVIFPWFGPRDGYPAHGFARVKRWDLKEITNTKNGGIELRFSLPESAKPSDCVAFDLEYVVSIGRTLGLELIVTNKSADKEFCYEDCLHTYFEVGNIKDVSVTGLKGVTYKDKVENFVEKVETNAAIKVSSEVDRVYMDTKDAVEIVDGSLKRKIRVEKENSASTVVWNPWIAKSRQMPDFGDEEFHRMICVESGNVGKNKLTLAPGKKNALQVKISSSAL